MSENVFDTIIYERMGPRKKKVLVDMNKYLKQYRDINDDVKRSVIADASKFPRLAFLNPQLLTVSIVMYNNGISEPEIARQPGLLDQFISQYVTVKKTKEGSLNDLLRYIVMVRDHYVNARALTTEIKRERMEAEAAKVEYEEEFEPEYEEDYGWEV
jgi:hypothetical protein